MVLLRSIALLLWINGAALAQDRFFDADGVAIRYLDRGAGPAVVLVHGFAGSIERSWINTGILQDLARDHRVLALDLRGHGRSDKPHEPLEYSELADDVIRLMDHAGVRRAHAVGYSLGGIILLKLLTTDPERFERVVIGGAAYRRARGADADVAAEVAALEIESGVYRALIVSTAPTDEPPPGEETILRLSRNLAEGNDVRAHAALIYLQATISTGSTRRKPSRCGGS